MPRTYPSQYLKAIPSGRNPPPLLRVYNVMPQGTDAEKQTEHLAVPDTDGTLLITKIIGVRARFTARRLKSLGRPNILNGVS